MDELMQLNTKKTQLKATSWQTPKLIELAFQVTKGGSSQGLEGTDKLYS